MKKIFVVEDDESICDELVQILENEGYEAESLKNFDNTKDDILKAAPNLVLMDINIPRINGRNLVKEIRKESDVPIIMVTSRTSEMDEVLSMSYGADDYITKPFGTAELLARLRTALRHAHRAESIRSSKTPFRADGLLVDYDKRRVLVDGEEIHFTQKEFNLISLLSVHAGRVLTYDFLMRNIWGTVPADSENSILRVNMASIRRKIEKDPAEPKYILTEMGVGYRMIEGD